MGGTFNFVLPVVNLGPLINVPNLPNFDKEKGETEQHKKVLPRERKRHTARRVVALTPNLLTGGGGGGGYSYPVVTGGIPIQSP